MINNTHIVLCPSLVLNLYRVDIFVNSFNNKYDVRLIKYNYHKNLLFLSQKTKVIYFF